MITNSFGYMVRFSRENQSYIKFVNHEEICIHFFTFGELLEYSNHSHFGFKFKDLYAMIGKILTYGKCGEFP
jgi:hypothetical protein